MTELQNEQQVAQEMIEHITVKVDEGLKVWIPRRSNGEPHYLKNGAFMSYIRFRVDTARVYKYVNLHTYLYARKSNTIHDDVFYNALTIFLDEMRDVYYETTVDESA